MEPTRAPPEESPPAPSPGSRPFVLLALVLGAGTWLGLAQREDPVSSGAGLVVGGLAALALARRGALPGWTAAVFVLAFARASPIAETPPSEPAPSALVAEGLRAAPLAGTWRARRDGRTGWLEPFAGEPRTPGHGLLFEPELVPPAEGTPVAILPGSEVLPWPRGPAPSPGTRARDFVALAPLAVDELVRLAPAPRWPGQALLEALEERLEHARAWLGERAARVEGPRSAGLLRALAIGAREGLTAERADLFARTGTSHLLAISGWHVGLFAALVLAPLAGWLPRLGGGGAGIAARALALVFFAGVAGGEKPVLRATLALLFVQLAGLVRARRAPPLRPDALSFLGAAFALECLLDPGGIRSLSLALSYAATLGLILGSGPLARRLRELRGDDEPWARLARGPLVWALRTRLGNLLVSGVAASSAAVLATLPLVWTTFGEFAPVGALLTVGALLPFTFLSLLAWLAALVPWDGLSAPAELGAALLYGWLELGDALPGTPWLVPPRPAALLALATALVFAGLCGRRACLRLGAALFGLLLLPWSAAPVGFELHALDVGHGSALVARAPGLAALVYDAGSRDRRGLASEALLPLLARWEADKVQIVLSHADQDHASGLGRLAERLPIRAWLGAEPAQGLVRPAHSRERLDLRLDLLQGRLECPAPCPELALALLRGAPRAGNEGSRALELTWRGERLLLLGDAEGAGLEGLPIAPGPLRLLLAPHHGSDAAGLSRLLARHPPAEVWISAAAEPAIARELSRRGIPWRWTARDGPLASRLP
jgi:competence protein ComEC